MDEIINYIEYLVGTFYDTSIADDDIFEHRKNILKFLNRNKSKIEVINLPTLYGDTSISLYFNNKFLTDSYFEYPSQNHEYPEEVTFDLLVTSFRDSNDQIFYNNNLEEEVSKGIMKLNTLLLKELDRKGKTERFPFIYEYKKDHLRNYIYGFELDTNWQHYKNIYNFLDSVAISNNLTSIITSCYHYELAP